MKKGMILVLAAVMITGLSACGQAGLSTGESASGRSISEQSVSGQVASASVKEGKEPETKEESGRFRYVSKYCFYTDFEGESMVQTDVVEANTICQRSLQGKLLHSYPMGDKFEEIFYVDENWLYYVELDGEDEGESINNPIAVYRAPLTREGGEEIPQFSQKEFVFKEPKGLGDSDFSENAFLQMADNTIYYYAWEGLGTYDLKTKKQKHYPVKGLMNAAGTNWIIAEGKKQEDVLTKCKTGESKVMKTETHPWLRLGKEYYFSYPYSTFRVDDLLLDLNSGETMKVLTKREGERIAEEMQIPWEKGLLEDDMIMEYIGYDNHRVYAEIQYPTVVRNKKGRKVEFLDAVCVSRDMDKEKGWRIEKKITAHARKKILKYYKQVVRGSYKQKKGEDREYMVGIGEGVANGIFYFQGTYKKEGKQAMDIYDLRKKEFRVIGRNSPETFYPFYDNSHRLDNNDDWQEIRELAPIMSQGETLWEQEQKRKNP